MPSFLPIFFAVFNYAFALWPFLLMSPFGNRKKNFPVLPAILAVWVMLAISRVLIMFSPNPIPPVLIPEPLNTNLFILAGVGLFALHLLLRLRQKRQFDLKLGSVHSTKDLMDLNSVEFEDMVVELYTAAGHQARRTGKSGDHGVDIVIQAKNGEKWIVQCKRWRTTVGEGVIRDFYGTMQHEKAHRGILVTSGKFSRPAYVWAKGKPLTLYDGEKLLREWRRSKSRKETTAIQQT